MKSKLPARIAKMDPDELKWEIHRLRAEIYKEHTNDFRGFSYTQVKTLRDLMDIKAHLESLSADPSQRAI